MGLESPISVLYNTAGYELAVSQSQVVSNSYQPGLVMAGSGSDGLARFFRVNSDGYLFVTGTFATSVATQSVQVASWLPGVTASVDQIGTSTTAITSANASTTNYTILPTNPNRRGALFFKEGTNTCYLKFGATATTSSYSIRLGSDDYYELPTLYTGQVDIVFNTTASNNTLRVTEFTLP